MQQETHAEALSLRTRGAELDELLVAARGRRTSARERREFMTEEAEEVRAAADKLKWLGMANVLLVLRRCFDTNQKCLVAFHAVVCRSRFVSSRSLGSSCVFSGF